MMALQYRWKPHVAFRAIAARWKSPKTSKASRSTWVARPAVFRLRCAAHWPLATRAAFFRAVITNATWTGTTSSTGRTAAQPSCRPGLTQPFADWLDLAAAHAGRGIKIDPGTATTGWRGERMDYGVAIDSLRFRSATEQRPQLGDTTQLEVESAGEGGVPGGDILLSP